jgi:hypothetical protein
MEENMKQRVKPKLLPPLVIPPEISGHRSAFIERIIQLISPDLVPGRPSAISDQKIEGMHHSHSDSTVLAFYLVE